MSDPMLPPNEKFFRVHLHSMVYSTLAYFLNQTASYTAFSHFMKTLDQNRAPKSREEEGIVTF